MNSGGTWNTVTAICLVSFEHVTVFIFIQLESEYSQPNQGNHHSLLAYSAVHNILDITNINLHSRKRRCVHVSLAELLACILCVQ